MGLLLEIFASPSPDRLSGDGIEDMSLDASTGTDSITYNGVSGVTENIKVSASAVPGTGQLSVPSVTLVDFKGVESISVNGNAPTTNETDVDLTATTCC